MIKHQQMFNYIKCIIFIEIFLIIARTLFINELIASELCNFITYTLFVGRIIVYVKACNLHSRLVRSYESLHVN